MSPNHKETQALGIYLGIHRTALFWIWTVSADIFGWTYLYLYLYLNRCICICICIWIKIEQNICICIWKIQIFVFVFAFVFDKTYLTPALRVTRDGVPMLANPFNWRVRWPRPARVPLFSLRPKVPRSPCGHSGRLLTHYRQREVRNSIYRYRKIHIDYRLKFSYRFYIDYIDNLRQHYSHHAFSCDCASFMFVSV